MKETVKIYGDMRKKVDALRIKNEIRNTDLARLLGMSRNNIGDMMDGTGAFTPRTLYLLCYILNFYILNLFPPQGTFKISKVKIEKVCKFQKFKLKLS